MFSVHCTTSTLRNHEEINLERQNQSLIKSSKSDKLVISALCAFGFGEGVLREKETGLILK